MRSPLEPGVVGACVQKPEQARTEHVVLAALSGHDKSGLYQALDDPVRGRRGQPTLSRQIAQVDPRRLVRGDLLERRHISFQG